MTDQNQNQEPNEGNQNSSSANASDKGGQHREGFVPKSRLDAEIQKKKEAEAELASVADSLKEEVPEEHRDLIPDLPPAALIKWLRAATAKGLFSKASPDSPGGGKRPNQKPPQDLTGLSPQAMMSMGYGKK